ncbi:V-type proton ATPase 116 kDa subunit a 1 isoform X1 [Hydra vulgaris]|nr:V-type proton ATPase 116 kDa subunit a 1 isoform X1 [Hydra vulgaris]
MISMFRSEEMALCQLFLQSESAYACVSELGEKGVVEFRDLNPDVNAFQRKFVNEVRRCDEMERKLRFMQKEIDKAGIPVIDIQENPDTPHPKEMIDMEAQFEQLENEMKDSNSNHDALIRSSLELTELKHILRKTHVFFDEAEHVMQEHIGDTSQPTAEEMSLLADIDYILSSQTGRLGFVAGVITRDRIVPFERLLWRACRGNVFFKQAEIENRLYDPSAGDLVYKCVFIVFFQGEQLKIRVKKICEGFHATLYPCPETPGERREMAIGVMTRIEDLDAVINETQEHRSRLLQTVAKNIKTWLIKVKKIKAVYHTMNMFNVDVTHKCLIAECWIPVADLNDVQASLKRGTEKSGASVPSIVNRMPTKKVPPTFNRTNKFTHGFQAIVDAYGVADYQEVNPALYTIITFPFLFSVMFGDLGHGAIMALFGFFLIYYEKKLAIWKAGGEMFDTVFHGRYIIFLMGLFSIYSGLIYNDIFSKSLNIFGSGWVDLKSNKSDYTLSYVEELAHTTPSAVLMLNPLDAARPTPYWFGIDPVWQLAVNKLTFTNSFKMKISVIFGVIHMMFGVVLSIFNHIHHREWIGIFGEFIPQLLFIGCIFGYLIFMIFYKWLVFSIQSPHAPSILLTLIGMFLKFAKPLGESELLYKGQDVVQPILVVVAVISVPFMLLSKPFYLRMQHNKLSRKRFGRLEESHVNVAADHEELHHKDDEEEKVFEFSEIFINQAIHTIEYCLGCISNTASYLRLWALSLAHAQLSEVLWSMVFHIGLSMKGYGGCIAVFVLFAAWGILTVAILLIMEGLSAFLHTLRLHWVEFNSKFYHGTGRKFVPFSFKSVLSEDQD